MTDDDELSKMIANSIVMSGDALAKAAGNGKVLSVLVLALAPAIPNLAAKGMLGREDLLRAYGLAEDFLSATGHQDEARRPLEIMHHQLAQALQHAR